MKYKFHYIHSQTSVYANISDLYQDTFNEDETFGYGDEKIYDSVLRYQANVCTLQCFFFFFF